MFDDVLVPTDGSDCAAVATGYARDLAARYGATVHALCVVDARVLDNAPHRDRLRAESVETAERTCDEVAEAGLAVERAVRTDVPHRAILEYAAEHGIDLVVMGTHGRTGVERYLLGSVTERVVRLSDVPVMTVSGDPDGAVTYPYADVLVPTDGSDGAGAAVGPAVDVAGTYGARLHALSVVDTMTTRLDAHPEDVPEWMEEAARTAVGAVEEEAARASVSPVETSVGHGVPYREIQAYVDEHGVDLVVMGTHGRSGIERYLLGSVTEKLVRTSPVPVLTVRRRD